MVDIIKQYVESLVAARTKLRYTSKDAALLLGHSAAPLTASNCPVPPHVPVDLEPMARAVRCEGSMQGIMLLARDLATAWQPQAPEYECVPDIVEAATKKPDALQVQRLTTAYSQYDMDTFTTLEVGVLLGLCLELYQALRARAPAGVQRAHVIHTPAVLYLRRKAHILEGVASLCYGTYLAPEEHD